MCDQLSTPFPVLHHSPENGGYGSQNIQASNLGLVSLATSPHSGAPPEYLIRRKDIPITQQIPRSLMSRCSCSIRKLQRSCELHVRNWGPKIKYRNKDAAAIPDTRILGWCAKSLEAETNINMFLMLQKKVQQIEEKNYFLIKKKYKWNILSCLVFLKKLGYWVLLSVCKCYTGQFSSNCNHSYPIISINYYESKLYSLPLSSKIKVTLNTDTWQHLLAVHFFI